MDIPWISLELDMHGISMGTPCISTQYIHGISMDIHGISLMYIVHGIYTAYPRIFLDIPSFVKPDFTAGPCSCSHSHHTVMWVIKSTLFHAPPWQLCQGKRLPTNFISKSRYHYISFFFSNNDN